MGNQGCPIEPQQPLRLVAQPNCDFHVESDFTTQNIDNNSLTVRVTCWMCICNTNRKARSAYRTAISPLDGTTKKANINSKNG